MQTVQAIPANDLVQGRTSTAQAAALATSLASSLNLPSQSDMSSTASYDGNTSDSTLIPMSISQTVNNIPYTIYTFIYACHLSAGSNNSCGSTATAGSTTGDPRHRRIDMDIKCWLRRRLPLRDQHAHRPQQRPDVQHEHLHTDGLDRLALSCDVLQRQHRGALAQLRMRPARPAPPETPSLSLAPRWSSPAPASSPISGYGFPPAAAQSRQTRSTSRAPPRSISACRPAMSLARYTVSVINTDGGHFQTTLTEKPIVRWVALSGSGSSQVLTLNGGGFVNGASYTGTGGISGTFNWVSPQQATITSYVGPTAGASPSITVNDPSPGFQQTPVFTLPDMSATTSPTSVAVGTNVSVAVSGSGSRAAWPQRASRTGRRRRAT